MDSIITYRDWLWILNEGPCYSMHAFGPKLLGTYPYKEITASNKNVTNAWRSKQNGGPNRQIIFWNTFHGKLQLYFDSTKLVSMRPLHPVSWCNILTSNNVDIFHWLFICHRAFRLYWMWPSDVTWRHTLGSTLVYIIFYLRDGTRPLFELMRTVN